MLQKKRCLAAENTPQYQDRRRDACLAQQNALLKEGYAQHLGSQFLHVHPNAHQSMPVGIGFENRHHRGCANVSLDSLIVLRQPVQVHLHLGWAQGEACANGGRVADFHRAILSQRLF